jgi:hypothetical protein
MAGVASNAATAIAMVVTAMFPARPSHRLFAYIVEILMVDRLTIVFFSNIAVIGSDGDHTKNDKYKNFRLIGDGPSVRFDKGSSTRKTTRFPDQPPLTGPV